MPIFEYVCDCGGKREVFKWPTESLIELCRKCGKEMKRQFSTFGFTHGIFWTGKQIGMKHDGLGQTFHTAHEKKMYFKAHPNLSEDPEYKPPAEKDPMPKEKIMEFIRNDERIEVK